MFEFVGGDETTVKSHSNTRRESAYVHSSDPALFQPKFHSGGISHMFWGCVSERTGPLITIDNILYREYYRLPQGEVYKGVSFLGGEPYVVYIDPSVLKKLKQPLFEILQF